jgi:hypothetical protein
MDLEARYRSVQQRETGAEKRRAGLRLRSGRTRRRNAYIKRKRNAFAKVDTRGSQGEGEKRRLDREECIKEETERRPRKKRRRLWMKPLPRTKGGEAGGAEPADGKARSSLRTNTFVASVSQSGRRPGPINLIHPKT